MTKDPRLPRVALRILAARLPDADRDWVIGDLCEEYLTEILPRRGPRAARAWFWRQALRSSASIVRARFFAPRERPVFPLRRQGDSMFQQMLDDLRFAARTYRKQPGFALAAVGILALGIGATTAVFTVIDGVLLRPLPYPDPDRLAVIRAQNLERNVLSDETSSPDFVDWRDGTDAAFAAMAAWTDRTVALTEGELAEELDAVLVSAGFFDVFGLDPQLGRRFLPGEGAPGREMPVIISHALWTRTFGADPGVVGSTIRLVGRPYPLVGVMPPEFRAPRPGVDVWMPMAMVGGSNAYRVARSLDVVARLEDGVSVDQAQEALDAVTTRLAEAYPESNAGWTARIVPALDDSVSSSRPFLMVILGAVALVLVIACVNVANLQLARAAARSREIAVRRALGADRWRLRRQLVIESLVLGLAGGGVGTVFAWHGVALLLRLAAGFLARAEQVGLDGRVLFVTFGVSVAASVAVGLAPTWREHGESSLRSPRPRRRQVLVVAEMATTLVLLIAAGLLLRSFLELRRIDPGYEIENLHAGRINLDEIRYPEGDDQKRYFAELCRRFESIPGVDEAALTSTLPLHPVGSDHDFPYRAEGYPEVPRPEAPEADIRLVSTNYFRTLGIPVVSGRTLDRRDRPDAPLAMVVNETFAGRVWPGEDALGKRVTLLYSHEPVFEVVGVVRDTRHKSLVSEPRPQFFIAYQQTRYPFDEMTVVVKSARRDRGLVSELRRQAAALDPLEPFFGWTTMEELVADDLARDRLAAWVVAVFAVVALVMAASGLYGVISYQVARRTREIGVRMALGAPRRRVVGLVVGEAARLSAAGVGLGLAAALACSRLLEGFLFGVSPTDPVVFVGLAMTLIVVALAASLLPALRAAEVEPLAALRQE